jgi:transcriptional regulator with XRE-family HTH domain
MITGAQVRAAKALLDWSGSSLAEEAGVAISTIRRVEACNGLLETASVKVLQAIKGALERNGVEFIGTPEDRPGVRLNTSKK